MGNHLSGCYEDLVHCGTLRRWIRKDETDTGKREGLTTSEREEFKRLQRENRELKKANELHCIAQKYDECGMRTSRSMAPKSVASA